MTRKSRHADKAARAQAVREYNRAGVEAATAALGAGDVDHWSDDTGDNATPVSGDFGGSGE